MGGWCFGMKDGCCGNLSFVRCCCWRLRNWCPSVSSPSISCLFTSRSRPAHFHDADPPLIYWLLVLSPPRSGSVPALSRRGLLDFDPTSLSPCPRYFLPLLC